MIHQRHSDLLPFLPAALSYARHLLKDSAAAEDVLQEVTIHALQTNHFPAVSDSLKPWLLRVVRNRCIDRIRGSHSEVDEQILDQVAAPRATDPERCLEQTQLRASVLSALAELPSEQRELLVLRELNECSYGDIAAILNIPAGTVMSSLHRARLALKAVIVSRMGES
ncbi:RNA polymerase sigma factor [Pseudidiomarina aestuarii]|uniref:RNA polymerase sigma factor n=1 Tax=Pseudidiomarina aestuarii TaxID=624146 RepID=A0A7Z6ZTB4_9GAMM|nr:sigma-70 family RNA polymerase sigma factor [Pseudidiomarina aestuarii]RUO41024.1 RNA polymerase sigma factor [Pseudidiomarina aestuarii]